MPEPTAPSTAPHAPGATDSGPRTPVPAASLALGFHCKPSRPHPARSNLPAPETSTEGRGEKLRKRATLPFLRLLNRIPPVLDVRRPPHQLRLPEPPRQVTGRLLSCFSRDFALGRGEARRVLARRTELLPQWAWRRGTGRLSSCSGSQLGLLYHNFPVNALQRCQPRPVSGHLHTLEHTLTPRFLSPLGKNGQRLRASKSSAWESISVSRANARVASLRGVGELVQAARGVGRRWSRGRRSLRLPLGLKGSAWFETLCLV